MSLAHVFISSALPCIPPSPKSVSVMCMSAWWVWGEEQNWNLNALGFWKGLFWTNEEWLKQYLKGSKDRVIFTHKIYWLSLATVKHKIGKKLSQLFYPDFYKAQLCSLSLVSPSLCESKASEYEIKKGWLIIRLNQSQTRLVSSVNLCYTRKLLYFLLALCLCCYN